MSEHQHETSLNPGEEPVYSCFSASLRIFGDGLDIDEVKYRTNSGTAGFEVDYRCLGLFAELQVPFGVSVIVA